MQIKNSLANSSTPSHNIVKTILNIAAPHEILSIVSLNQQLTTNCSTYST